MPLLYAFHPNDGWLTLSVYLANKILVVVTVLCCVLFVCNLFDIREV